MCAKHHKNPTMLSRVTAKNVGDVFLRHGVRWPSSARLLSTMDWYKRERKREFVGKT